VEGPQRVWRALVLAYTAGEDGLAGKNGDYGGIGWPTWSRLLDYRQGAQVAERGGLDAIGWSYLMLVAVCMSANGLDLQRCPNVAARRSVLKSTNDGDSRPGV